MTVYYTGRGDDGTTGILSGARISKSDVLLEAIGNLDELNSTIGVALAQVEDAKVRAQLVSIQNDLFVLGVNLSSADGRKIAKAQMNGEDVARLEAGIKELGGMMPDLKQFVLPGGCKAAAALHLARAVARRAERSVDGAAKAYKIDGNILAYLNRLSSYLFVAALYLNLSAGAKESHPTY